MNEYRFDTYTITGNTHKTKNLVVGYVDTTEEFAFDNFVNETIFDIADKMYGQDKADEIVSSLKCNNSFDKAFALLKSWGYGIRFQKETV